MSSATLYPFLSISVAAGPGVLAPREETELLGRTGLACIENLTAPLVIDLCCGAGNLGLAIAASRSDARVFLSDLTNETVAQTRQNALRLGLAERVQVGQGDMFDGIVTPGGEKADLIVCNPPYISTGKLAGESAFLLDKEPREAFDAGAYGIAIHQRLIAEAPPFLKPGGWLAFEFGNGQDRQVDLLVKRSGAYEALQFARDAAGMPRVAYVRLRKSG